MFVGKWTKKQEKGEEAPLPVLGPAKSRLKSLQVGTSY